MTERKKGPGPKPKKRAQQAPSWQAELAHRKLRGEGMPGEGTPTLDTYVNGDAEAGTREQNIALFYRYIECENKRDYKNLEKLFHPTDFVCTTWFGFHPIRPQALTRMLRGLFIAFPDWYMTINEIISADETSVAGRITGRGTQRAEFMGRKPIDHQIAIPLIHCIRVRDGLIVEYRATNPFDDPFRADIVAPEDVQAARAQQGFDSSLSTRLITAARESGLAQTETIAGVITLHEVETAQCQALLKSNMRRCTIEAAPGEIYCATHLAGGYGID